MQEAGIVTLFRTILILLLVYYAFKFLARLLAPYVMRKMAAKMQNQTEQYYNHQTRNTTVKEGETVIDKKPYSKKPSNNDDAGEYVDFEEID